MGSALESTQTGQSVLNRTEMNTHRNALKMHTYLLCQFVDMFENELNANAKSVVGANVSFIYFFTDTFLHIVIAKRE